MSSRWSEGYGQPFRSFFTATAGATSFVPPWCSEEPTTHGGGLGSLDGLQTAIGAGPYVEWKRSGDSAGNASSGGGSGMGVTDIAPLRIIRTATATGSGRETANRQAGQPTMT